MHAGGRGFGALLHSRLVRIACGQTIFSGQLLDIFCAHLRCYSLASPAQRMWVIDACAADVVDAVESAEADGVKSQYPANRSRVTVKCCLKAFT